MNASTRRRGSLFGRVTGIGIALLVVGTVVLIVAIGLDWAGFAGGLVQGAAVGAMVVGGYFWGFGNGIHRRGGNAAWLPSRNAPE